MARRFHPSGLNPATLESRKWRIVFRPPVGAVLAFENNNLAQRIYFLQPLPRLWRGAPLLARGGWVASADTPPTRPPPSALWIIQYGVFTELFGSPLSIAEFVARCEVRRCTRVGASQGLHAREHTIGIFRSATNGLPCFLSATNGL